MITSNLVVEGVPGNHHHHPHHHHALAAAGTHPLHSFGAIHHHLSHHGPSSRAHLMSASTFAEPFLKASNGPTASAGSSLLQPSPPEFAHPLPKPAPIVPRYNGVTSGSLNGAAVKPHPPQRLSKYPEPESAHAPVNLVQSKEPPAASSPQSVAMEVVGHPYGLYTSASRLYQPNPTYAHFAAPPPPSSLANGPYGPLYPPNPFQPLLHRGDGHRPAHLLGLQYPEASATPPHHRKSPPSAPNGMLKTVYEPPLVPIVASEAAVSLGRPEKRFKVPSGKEGSLKHRILTRPEPARGAHKKSAARAGHANALLPPPSACAAPSAANAKNGLVAGCESAATAHATSYGSVCNGGDCAASTILPKFIKGSLIQLADGSTKKVEDMQTEDFITCVENSATMRIDPSTVVRIQESAHRKGMTTVTLSYGEQRNQVDVESSVEHPYFVVKRGWSSCMPNKTLQVYRLLCHQLQVGDVCLTLSPKVAANASRKSNAGGAHRRPNGQTAAGHVEPSKGSPAAPKKHDLRVASAVDNDVDDCRSTSASCNGSSNGNISCNGTNGAGHQQLHQAAAGGSGDGKFCRQALLNGHDEAKRSAAKAADNDDNNNSNSTGDKYEAAGAKKKRRWSAPEQIGDEYQPPSVSPLASPPVSVAACATVASNNNV